METKQTTLIDWNLKQKWLIIFLLLLNFYTDRFEKNCWLKRFYLLPLPQPYSLCNDISMIKYTYTEPFSLALLFFFFWILIWLNTKRLLQPNVWFDNILIFCMELWFLFVKKKNTGHQNTFFLCDMTTTVCVSHTSTCNPHSVPAECSGSFPSCNSSTDTHHTHMHFTFHASTVQSLHSFSQHELRYSNTQCWMHDCFAWCHHVSPAAVTRCHWKHPATLLQSGLQMLFTWKQTASITNLTLIM